MKQHNNKRSIILLSLIIVFISVSCVSATEESSRDDVATLQDSADDFEDHDSISHVDNKNNGIKLDYNLVINSSNYNDYFDDGYARSDKLADVNQITLCGEFEDTNFIMEDVNLNITGDNATLRGSTIVIYDNVTVSNIFINNSNKELANAIVIYGDNCVITDCNFSDYTTTDVIEIYVIGSNNTIINNNINVTGPSDAIDWDSDPDLARCLSIAIVSSNNIVQSNNISTYSSISKVDHGTIESITIQGSLSGDKAENNVITNNTIITNGSDYSYGVNLGTNIDNNTITNNNITTIGGVFADSIQAFSSVSNLTITDNTIYSSSGNVSDGIAISKDGMAGSTSYNNISNNVITVYGNISTLIDTGSIDNSIISNNTCVIEATNANGFIIKGDNNNITDNYIEIVSSNSDDTGILLNGSSNNNIMSNTIKTNTEYTIYLINSNDNNVYNNKLSSSNLVGDNSVYSDGTNNVTDNKQVSYSVSISVDDITSVNNVTINITAIIVDENNNPVSEGKVVFKINNNSLRDDEDYAIYVNVINGRATLCYNLPSWQSKEYTIQCVYSGSDNYESERSDNTTLTIVNHNATLEVASNTTVRANTTITLVTKITEDGLDLQSGNVVFKLNGVTLKDSNDNPYKITVTNGSATLNYDITNMSAKDYVLTVVYSDKYYNRAEINTKLTITK